MKNFVGYAPYLLFLSGLVEQHDKFVATESRNRIVLANTFQQAFGHADQQGGSAQMRWTRTAGVNCPVSA